ncbi:MAG: 4-(cytidine 5'-diphospho)-2-C-methyl-D-erythritol kinase [Planctomycetia bacterium]|nr:4-(cytidine 5'-diphospho)-2-C-methyl-D-erythritol kinase [Planctomycetia bacterium]
MERGETTFVPACRNPVGISATAVLDRSGWAVASRLPGPWPSATGRNCRVVGWASQIGLEESISVCAPAKLNLSLQVLARRPDGFHEIESLMVPVTLHDQLRLKRQPEGVFTLQVRFRGRLAQGNGRQLARDVPTDDRNLAIRAVRLLAERAGVTAGLAIELDKEIPSGAGLAGGSSDAAAAMQAAAGLWGLDWSAERLAALSAEIGSDIPWFFARSAGLVAGRGEQVLPVTGIRPLPVVIACPAEGLSTAAVYAACQPDASRRGEAAALAAALAAGELRRALPLLENMLEPPARRLAPTVDRLLSMMSRLGAVRPLLTGSGSACFSLCRTSTEARRLASRLEAAGCPGVFWGRLTPGRVKPPKAVEI